MKREQFIRELRKDAKAKGLTFAVDMSRGKGGRRLVRRPVHDDQVRRNHAADGRHHSQATWPLTSDRGGQGVGMQYQAKFQPDGQAVLVTFPDVPEAITGGANEAEASANAVEALEVALLTYVAEGRPLPPPTRHAAKGSGSRLVFVPAATAAKIALIAAFRESGLTRVALAARLGKNESEVRRMLDPYHRTKLPAIEAALRALGKRLIVTVKAA